MSCTYCGSDAHPSENCPTRKLVKFLTSEETVPPQGLPKLVVTTEENLIETVEEAHALMHVKKKNEGGDAKP